MFNISKRAMNVRHARLIQEASAKKEHRDNRELQETEDMLNERLIMKQSVRISDDSTGTLKKLKTCDRNG